VVCIVPSRLSLCAWLVAILARRYVKVVIGGDGGDEPELANADAELALRAPYDALDGDAVDRMLYADSMIRLPDHAARMPSDFKVRGRNLRYIQRKLAARYPPPEILIGSKQGFSSALPQLERAYPMDAEERRL
jgi:Asparagine synthase